MLRRSQANSRSLAEALDRNEQLFSEIHHRVKNNLQSVSALLQVHKIPNDVRVDLTQRILAMSAVHEHIYRSGDFSNVRIKGYLHTLIAHVKAGADPNIIVVDELEDIAVDKDTAGPLGLILNEVLANCFKHAFPHGRGGNVKVSLHAVGNGLAQLVVEDDGAGFDEAAPGTGIGRKLVAGFVKQLNGEYSVASGQGSKFVLTFPAILGNAQAAGMNRAKRAEQGNVTLESKATAFAEWLAGQLGKGVPTTHSDDYHSFSL